MNLDPITISKWALFISALGFCVSLTSLLLSIFNKQVDKKIQFEQVRGEIRTMLTSRGIEALEVMDKLNYSPVHIELIDKLHRLLKGMVYVRTTLQDLKYPAVVELQKILSDVKDMEPVFESLFAKANSGDWSGANVVINGLLQRYFNPAANK